MGSPSPRGIIFDLDGTLIDTLYDIALTVNDVLESLRKEPLTRDAVRSYVGDGLSNLLATAYGTDDPHIVTDLVASYKPIYRRRMFDHARLYPGIAETLDALTAASHPLAILSNKSHDFVAPFVERMLNRWTWVRVCGLQPSVPRKPDPTQALEIAAAMPRAPAEVVFVGDSVTDVRTAQAAGMTPIGVTWGYRSRAELQSAGAACLIDDPRQLMVEMA